MRGADLIDVTNIVRPIWRAHLAYWFPQLPPETRAWFASAPIMLANVRAQWPLLQPWQQAQMVQQWSFELPQMLWMVDPVLAQAQAAEMSQRAAESLAAMRQDASRAQPVAQDSEATLNAQLASSARTTAGFINFSNKMTNATIDLMRSINYQNNKRW